MSRTAKNRCLRVGFMAFVLLVTSLSPTYGQPKSKPEPATKAKIAALIEKLKDKDDGVRKKAGGSLVNSELGSGESGQAGRGIFSGRRRPYPPVDPGPRSLPRKNHPCLR